ncbi:MAG: hypothetical protein HYV63_12965 [Candidatus Schekmanbacteria bacterium]|nr:hypothetical protein [Candidatus Schekmanbacteria bacterium]
MSGQVRLLGILHCLFGVIGVVGAAGLLGLSASSPLAEILGLPAGSAAAVFAGRYGTAVLLLAIAISAIDLVTGIGLLTRSPWARVPCIAMSVLYLPAVPIGTAIGYWGLKTLLSSGGQQWALAAADTHATPALSSNRGCFIALFVIGGLAGCSLFVAEMIFGPEAVQYRWERVKKALLESPAEVAAPASAPTPGAPQENK